MKDTIITELRKIRDHHAATFKYDLNAIALDLQRKERMSRHKLVKLKPRKIAKS